MQYTYATWCSCGNPCSPVSTHGDADAYAWSSVSPGGMASGPLCFSRRPLLLQLALGNHVLYALFVRPLVITGCKLAITSYQIYLSWEQLADHAQLHNRTSTDSSPSSYVYQLPLNNTEQCSSWADKEIFTGNSSSFSDLFYFYFETRLRTRSTRPQLCYYLFLMNFLTGMSSFFFYWIQWVLDKATVL